MCKEFSLSDEVIIVEEWFIFITRSFNDNFGVTLKNNGWKTKVLQNLEARTVAMDSTLATEWGKSIYSFIDAKIKPWEFRTTTLIHASRLLKHWTITQLTLTFYK